MKIPSKKPKTIHQLSVVLATYNEAHNLARCLDSVRALWDELIIVDGESSDETREIAQDYGAQIIKTTNKLNFHINKQMANDQAKYDLILQLDADEVVDEELLNFIQKLKQTPELPYDAFRIRRKNLFMGQWMKKGGQYPDPVIRLFRKGQACLPMKSVHEQMQVKGQTGWADGHLIHNSNPTFALYMKKFATYTSFTAQILFEQKLPLNFMQTLKYFLFMPVTTFCLLFFRHKGMMDGWVGFVFALMSGLHHPMAYLKLWELYERKKT
ncbi:MAG: glycosyltransferase family 2 protein [Patescibacteria group bacterium]|nr:glycosyltransferase family 2 protein [Patescibacteria group bacterium]